MCTATEWPNVTTIKQPQHRGKTRMRCTAVNMQAYIEKLGLTDHHSSRMVRVGSTSLPVGCCWGPSARPACLAAAAKAPVILCTTCRVACFNTSCFITSEYLKHTLTLACEPSKDQLSGHADEMSTRSHSTRVTVFGPPWIAVCSLRQELYLCTVCWQCAGHKVIL